MMPRRSTAICYALLAGLGGELAHFEIRSAANRVPPTVETNAAVSAIAFTISFETLQDVRRLDQRSEIAEIIAAAHHFSDSPIFLEAYITADDARESTDATGVAVADELVIAIGGYLASCGVEADRISGKGMGIDSAIGRAVVVSFGITATDPQAPLRWLGGGPEPWNRPDRRSGSREETAMSPTRWPESSIVRAARKFGLNGGVAFQNLPSQLPNLTEIEQSIVTRAAP